MPNDTSNLPSVSYYTPVELVGIYRSFLERGRSNGVVWLRGIYVPKQQGQGWASCYDELKDVKTNVTVTIRLNQQDRQKLKPQSLIHVGGLIELNPFANGTIQILVNVTRVEIVKDQFVTEQDMKRSEIRIAKSKKGFKNVDAVLEDKLFRDERPKVALVFATTSITMADFTAGVNAAAVKIDFTEQRQSFANAKTLSVFLKTIDTSGFDVIALIRGGGSGIESLDDVKYLLVGAKAVHGRCAGLCIVIEHADLIGLAEQLNLSRVVLCAAAEYCDLALICVEVELLFEQDIVIRALYISVFHKVNVHESDVADIASAEPALYRVHGVVAGDLDLVAAEYLKLIECAFEIHIDSELCINILDAAAMLYFFAHLIVNGAVVVHYRELAVALYKILVDAEHKC